MERTYLVVWKSGATAFLYSTISPEKLGWFAHLPLVDYWQEWKVKND